MEADWIMNAGVKFVNGPQKTLAGAGRCRDAGLDWGGCHLKGRAENVSTAS